MTARLNCVKKCTEGPGVYIHWTELLDWTTGPTHFWVLHMFNWFRWLQGTCSPSLNGEHKQFIKQKQSSKDFSTSIALAHTAHV